jgi:hypothetical protein
MGISCYRVYDHDIPEFPFCIELYGEHLYVAEYLRHHGMEDEIYAQWLEESLACAQRITIQQDLFVTRRLARAAAEERMLPALAMFAIIDISAIGGGHIDIIFFDARAQFGEEMITQRLRGREHGGRIGVFRIQKRTNIGRQHGGVA